MKTTFGTFLAVITLCTTGASGQSPAPNVIFILTDDIGTGDFSTYDNLDGVGVTAKTPTPNIDQLAREGMRFTQAHSVASLCAPTRAGTLTGSNLWHANIRWGMGGTVFKPGQKGIGDIMQNAGYRTAFLGKMHLGGTFYNKNNPGQTVGSGWSNVNSIDFDTPIKDGLQEHGFHYSLGLNAGIQGGPYFYFENGSPVQMDTSGNATPITNATYTTQVQQWSNGTYNGGQTVISAGGWGSTDFNTMHVPQQMAQNAVNFMADNVTNHASNPFFMYYATVGVHTPHVPHTQMKVDLNGDGDTVDANETTAVDGYDGSGPAPDDLGTNRMQMVNTIDAELGMLRSYLEATDDPRNPGHKLIDNTMIILTSDNGGHGWGAGEAIPTDWTTYEHDGSGGLRDRKGSIYEGGHRVPMIVKWKDRVEEDVARDQLIGTHDVMATMAGLANQSLVDQAKDSFNLMPVLLGQRDDSDPVRDHMIIEHISGQGQPKGNAYYEDRWKLMVNRTNLSNPAILGFYDLATDPTEGVDLSTSSDPAIQARISEMYANYLQRRNSARTAPVFVAKGDTIDVNTVAAYNDVTVEGTLAGNGQINGDLDANDGSTIQIIGSGSPTISFITLTPSQDTNIKAGSPGTNYNSQRLAIGATGAGAARSLVEFDLAGAPIPAGGAVQGAELVLTVGFSQGSGPQSHTVELYKLATDFSETTATWNQADSGNTWTTPGGDLGTLLDTIPNYNPPGQGSGDTLNFLGATFESDVLASLNDTAYSLLVKLDSAAEASSVLGSVWANSKDLGSPKPRLVLEVLAPGTRRLTVLGDYTQRVGSTLEIDLGAGTTAGADYDLLSVTGNVVLLGGDLSVSLDDGYTPVLGDTFDILDFASLTGAFDTVDLPALTGNLGWGLKDLLTTGEIRVVAGGDFDENGMVDDDDLALWTSGYGKLSGATRLDGDADGNGAVDGRDFLIWQRTHGTISPIATQSMVAVPEPSTWTMLLAILCVSAKQHRSLLPEGN
ncbi:MAG: sulfatase-like hydrolase/transferase [Pirellulales bacterium]|nr:sulfatase-like hydrolase/transferase [Pirellulales bacterium]